MIMSDKGEVIIPLEFQEKAGLTPGCEVEFRMDGKLITIRKAGTLTREEELTILWQTVGPKGMTTEELMQSFRGTDWGRADIDPD